MPPALPRVDEQGDDHQGEKSGIERIGNDDPPETRLAPDEVEPVVLATGVEFTRILPQHEVPEHLRGVRIEPEPEPEEEQRRRDGRCDAPGITDQEGGGFPIAGPELPE